MRNLDKMDVG